MRTKVHVCNKLRESVHLVQKDRLSPNDGLAHNSRIDTAGRRTLWPDLMRRWNIAAIGCEATSDETHG